MMMKKYILMNLLVPSIAIAGTTNFTPSTAAAYLNLTPPVAVEMAGGYMDGDSIGVTLVDVNSNKFHMFEDHSLANGLAGRKDLPEPLRIYENITNTAGRIYVAEDRPTRGGRLTSVEEGVLTKAAVVCLAQDWVQHTTRIEEPKETRDNLRTRYRARMLNSARDFILRLWEPAEPTTASTPTNHPAHSPEIAATDVVEAYDPSIQREIDYLRELRRAGLHEYVDMIVPGSPPSLKAMSDQVTRFGVFLQEHYKDQKRVDDYISNAIYWRHPERGCLYAATWFSAVAGRSTSKSRGIPEAEVVPS